MSDLRGESEPSNVKVQLQVSPAVALPKLAIPCVFCCRRLVLRRTV